MPGRTQPTRHNLLTNITGSQAQGKSSGLQQEMLVVDPRWVGTPNAPGSWPPPSGDPDQNYAVTKIGNTAGFTMPGPPTLTTALTEGTAYTGLPVTGLACTLYAGQVIVLVSGGSGGLVQAWTVGTGGAAPGAASIPVESQDANASFPAGTIISGAAGQVPGFGISMWRQGQVLTSELTDGDTYTALACTAFLPGIAGTALAGQQITVIQPGPLPAASQTWTLSEAVNGNDSVENLPVVSQAAQATFPAGSLVGIWMPL